MRALLALPLLLGSCTGGDDNQDLGPRGDCNPVDPALCALPWPSGFFETEDATTASGVRLDFALGTLPGNRDGVAFRPDAYNEKDGYSILGPMFVYFADLDPAGLVGHDNIGASLAVDASIVIIDAETRVLVPWFAELDATAEYDDERLLIIRPVVPMRHGARYIVGVRGLSTRAGGPVAVSKGFAELRDGERSDDPDVERQRAHYDEGIFPVLEQLGWTRGELQTAWDFTTVSRQSSLGPAEHARDDAAQRLGTDGPAYTITSIEDSACDEGATIGRTIYGEMTVPMYVDSARPPAFLTRGDDGLPYYNGDTQVDFMVRVPCSLIEDPRPGLILQYGHGLLGDFGEARTGYLSRMADDFGWVVVATSWDGMAGGDRGAITQMLAIDPSDFNFIPERTVQGFIQQDALLRMARGALGRDEALTFNGVSVIDPERFAYYGNSQGGILGAGYSGFSTQLERVVLGVGGMPYALLLQRSADFDPFFLVFKAKYIDHRDITLLIGAFQTVWDVGEGAGWAHVMNMEPGEGQPAKKVLMQVGIGDAQVTTLGAHIMARSYGASTLAPANREIWGVPEVDGPVDGSAIVEWYYPDGAEEPVENVPPSTDGDTHECPRREPAAQEQLRRFVETGIIEQTCEGPCVGTREGFCD